MAFRTLFLLFFLATRPLLAQISTQELPYSHRYNLSLPATEPLVVHFEESMIDKEVYRQEFPMFAGVSIPVNERFSRKAHPTLLPDGSVLWHVMISVPGAKALGIVFSDFHMQGNDKLFIFDDTKKHHIGAFTQANHSNHGNFSTQILPASTLFIEYHTQNTSLTHPPDFTIEEIVYLTDDTFFQPPGESGKSSGECNVNVNCPEGQMWQKQKRGVARILLRQQSSWFNCTGSLINNTANDGTPYFLTSDHCGSSASNEDLQVWQFYFNYEYADCPNNGDTPNTRMLTGATLIAKAPISQGSDFKLLLLNDDVPLNWNPYFNGWSVSSRDPQEGTGIHHPSGDPKKISTYTNPLQQATFTGGMPNGYWKVVWEETESGHGVTEGGSSGSPIFDQHGLIAGTLTGGGASCANPTQPDYYGKFYRHWIANGDAPEKKLQPWLDPAEENPEQLFGYDPNTITNFVIVEIDPPLSGTIEGAGYYAQEENVSLSALPDNEFRFIEWTNEEGQTVSTSEEYQFSMPEDEVVLTAHFTDKVNIDSYHELTQNIQIYPNPAQDIIKIKFAEINEPMQITLTSPTGQMVTAPALINPWEEHVYEISLNQVGPGIYFLNFETSKSSTTKKIVVN